MNKRRLVIAVGWAGALLGGAGVSAEPLVVPNGSFELPQTDFVSTRIYSWQETPQPEWYEEDGFFLWDQLTGVFRNTLPGAPDHIDNCDGLQAAYFFAIPEVGLFQHYDSVDWNDAEPTHDFDVRFTPGHAYELKFGVVAGGGNMLEGVSFEGALYFLDDEKKQTTVAATNVVFTRSVFPTRTTLTDITLRTDPVQATDPWAGRHLGIRFLSTVSDEMKGGYWDLDHVRLTAIPLPVLALDFSFMGAELRLSWASVVGYRYQLKTSEDLHSWTDYGAARPGTGGELEQAVPLSSLPNTWFRVEAAVTP